MISLHYASHTEAYNT